MDKQGSYLEDAGAGGVEVSREAAKRIMEEWGRGLEALQDYLTWKPNRDLYVYQVVVRRPIATGQEFLVILKAVREGEPVIAFNGGSGYIDALVGAARRGRAGKLRWQVDDMPPQKWAGIIAEVEYYQGVVDD